MAMNYQFCCGIIKSNPVVMNCITIAQLVLLWQCTNLACWWIIALEEWQQQTTSLLQDYQFYSSGHEMHQQYCLAGWYQNGNALTQPTVVGLLHLLVCCGIISSNPVVMNCIAIAWLGLEQQFTNLACWWIIALEWQLTTSWLWDY